MLPLPDNHATGPLVQMNETLSNTAPQPVQLQRLPPYTPNTDHLSTNMPRTTGYLSGPLPRTTRQLPSTGVFTSKLPTLIPATEKRTPRLPDTRSPRRHRPLVLISVMVSSIAILLLGTLSYVTPLGGDGQHPQSIAQFITKIFSTGAQSSFIPSQHPTIFPTAAPSLMRGEGYCGGTDIWGVCAKATTSSGVMGTGVMQRPIAGAVITQVFANPEYQRWCGCTKPHSGIDLAAPYGTPVTASDSGQVIWVGWDWSGLGWAVKISHGNYVATIYGHLASYKVMVGQNVTKGQVIAYEGSTGDSTGPHVHFMLLINNTWVNPAQYMQLP